MTKAILWIGGATAATVLLFGGVSIAARFMNSEAVEAVETAAPDIEAVIPVDPAKFGPGQADQERGEISDPADAQDAELTEETVAEDDATENAGRGENAARVRDGETIYDARENASRTASRSTPARTTRTSAEPLVVKRVLPIDGPIRYGEWHWDTDGVPPGKIVMTVDLDARVISVFRGGYEIGAAAVLLGTQEHPTPIGTFPIRYKMRHNVSEKYDNAPMPYSMFLTSDGIALHGSQVENGYASHGCIGMPDEFAAKVFAVASKGDRVIITRGKTLQMGSPIL